MTILRLFHPREIAAAIGEAWCQLTHPDPMWPVKGEYQCRVCQRRYPVAWERKGV